MPASNRRPPAPPSAALVVRNQLDEMIETYRGNFEAIMPSHMSAASFMGLAVDYIRANPVLNQAAAANPGSLIIALRETAALGHAPSKDTMALVAYRSNREKHPEHNGWNISAIEMVNGTKQRIFRAGAIKAIIADVVRDKDYARFQRTTMDVPEHQYDEFADASERGPLRAVYAYGRFADGSLSTVVWMPKSVVLKHRAVSKAGDSFWGPVDGEGPWTERMWLKTAVHRLSDEVPASAEYLWETARAQAAAGKVAPPAAPSTPQSADPGVWDGEYTDVPPDGAQAGTGGEEWPETAQPPSGK